MLHLVRLNEMRPRVEASVRSAGVTAPIRSLCDDVRRGSEVVLVGTVAKVGYDDDCIQGDTGGLRLPSVDIYLLIAFVTVVGRFQPYYMEEWFRMLLTGNIIIGVDQEPRHSPKPNFCSSLLTSRDRRTKHTRECWKNILKQQQQIQSLALQ